jgi:hypothetical protein
MAAEVEDALGRRIDFLISSDVEAMKDVEANNLILKNAGQHRGGDTSVYGVLPQSGSIG